MSTVSNEKMSTTSMSQGKSSSVSQSFNSHSQTTENSGNQSTAASRRTLGHLTFSSAFFSSMLVLGTISVAVVAFVPTLVSDASRIKESERLYGKQFIDAAILATNQRFAMVFNSTMGFSKNFLRGWRWLDDTEIAKHYFLDQHDGDPSIVYLQCGIQRTGYYTQLDLTQSPLVLWDASNHTMPCRHQFILTENRSEIPRGNWRCSYDPRRRNWYSDLNHSGIEVGRAYAHTNGVSVGLPFGGQFFDPVTKEMLGVCTLDLSTHTLSNVLKETPIGFTGSAVLFEINTSMILGLSWNETILDMSLFNQSDTNPIIRVKNLSNIGDLTSAQGLAIRTIIHTIGIEKLMSASLSAPYSTGTTYELDGYYFHVKDFRMPNIRRLWLRSLFVIPTGDVSQTPTSIALYFAIGIIVLSVVLQSYALWSSVSRLRHVTETLQNIENFNTEDFTPHETNSLITELAMLEKGAVELHRAFRSFVRYGPREVILDLIDQGNLLTDSTLQKTKCTVLVVDIERFTQLCTMMSPENVSLTLKNYYNVQCDIIWSHFGTIENFVGDSILAVWGAPVPVPNPEITAVDAGLDLADSGRQSCRLHQLQARVGISSGLVLAGNVGGDFRMVYTVLGTPVNVATSLQGLCSTYKSRLLISGEVKRVVHEQYLCRLLDHCYLDTDKSERKLYEVMGRLPPLVMPSNKSLGASLDHQTLLSPKSPLASTSAGPPLPSPTALVVSAATTPVTNPLGIPTINNTQVELISNVVVNNSNLAPSNDNSRVDSPDESINGGPDQQIVAGALLTGSSHEEQTDSATETPEHPRSFSLKSVDGCLIEQISFANKHNSSATVLEPPSFPPLPDDGGATPGPVTCSAGSSLAKQAGGSSATLLGTTQSGVSSCPSNSSERSQSNLGVVWRMSRAKASKAANSQLRSRPVCDPVVVEFSNLYSSAVRCLFGGQVSQAKRIFQQCRQYPMANLELIEKMLKRVQFAESAGYAEPPVF